MALHATPGKTEVALVAKVDNGVSPACGCLNPQDDWFGIGLPSRSFDLDVEVPRTPAERPTWALTLMSPEVDATDWFGTPAASIMVDVARVRDGRSQQLFSGRTTHVVVLTEAKISVEHGGRYPFAALTPASGGSTTIDVTRGSRSQFGSQAEVTMMSPRRDSHADGIFSEEGYDDPALLRRGPIIDVLGPTIEMSTRHEGLLSIVTGLKPVAGIRPGDKVLVSVRVPFAGRIIAHPASGEWLDMMASPALWQRWLQDAEDNDSDLAAYAKETGPELQGRYVDTSPQLAFRVHLRNVLIPAASDWKSFADESAARNNVKSFVDPMENEGPTVALYNLPPVSQHVEIGVMGPLSSWKTDSVSGDVSVDSATASVVRGRMLEVTSTSGISSDSYEAMAIASAGPETSAISFSGPGRMHLDGQVLSHIRFLPAIITLIGLALFGLMVETAIRWMTRRSQTK